MNTNFTSFRPADAEKTKAFRSFCRARPIVLQAIGKHDSTHVTISIGAAIGLMTSGAGFRAWRSIAGIVVISPE